MVHRDLFIFDIVIHISLKVPIFSIGSLNGKTRFLESQPRFLSLFSSVNSQIKPVVKRVYAPRSCAFNK